MTPPSEDRREAARGFGPSRRAFLAWLTATAGALVAATVAVPLVAVALDPLLRRRKPAWRAVGKVSDFTVGNTVKVTFENASPRPWAGPVARSAAWLRRESEQEFYALTLDCAHLGCPVRWDARAELFLCPCHGGVYYADGKVAGGPPPHALKRYPVRVKDGQVEIQTSPLPITT